MWISVKDEMPPKDPRFDYGDFQDSVNVLATDGKVIYFVYFQFWDDPEYMSKWKLVGRDGWDIEEIITHWMRLPELP